MLEDLKNNQEQSLIVEDQIDNTDSQVYEGDGSLNQKDSVVFKGKHSDVKEHRHDGEDLQPVNLQDIANFFPTVDTAPTQQPKKFFDQIRLYSSGGTYRLYIYDTTDKAWRYASLT